MTEPVRPLEALIERWRDAAEFEQDGARSSQYAAAMERCADELAALLQAAAPPAPTAEQEYYKRPEYVTANDLLLHIQRGHSPFNCADYIQCSCGTTFWFPAKAAPPAPIAELDEHRRLKYSQMDLDSQTKPLHVEIEGLRAAQPAPTAEPPVLLNSPPSKLDMLVSEYRYTKMSAAAEMLWIVLANVSGGDWTQQSKDWQGAAARWRDNYFVALKASSCAALPERVSEGKG